MSRHVMMAWAAGGGLLVGAALTYLATRFSIRPRIALAGAEASRATLQGFNDRIAGLWRTATRPCRATAAPVNAAFAEYRDETLRRLEQEEREFQDYLSRLRMARDRAEFERFMATRQAPGSAAPA